MKYIKKTNRKKRIYIIEKPLYFIKERYLEDLEIPEDLIKSFRKLFARFNKDDKNSELKRSFVIEANKHLNKIIDKPEEQTNYFKMFIPIWDFFVSKNDLESAKEIWLLSINPIIYRCSELTTINKSIPYYYYGRTLLIQGYKEQGFSFYNRALIEAQKKSISLNYEVSSVLLLNDNFNESNFDVIHFLNQEKFSKNLAKYNLIYSRKLNKEKFISSYLKNKTNPEITTLFSYIMYQSWEINQDLFPFDFSRRIEDFHNEHFQDYIQNSILFSLIQNIDNILKAKNITTNGDYYNLLIALSNKILPRKKNISKMCDKINSEIKNHNYEIKLLFKNDFPAGINPEPIQLDFIKSYFFRNYFAHHLSPIVLNNGEFDELFDSNMRIFMACVDFLI